MLGTNVVLLKGACTQSLMDHSGKFVHIDFSPENTHQKAEDLFWKSTIVSDTHIHSVANHTNIRMNFYYTNLWTKSKVPVS